MLKENQSTTEHNKEEIRPLNVKDALTYLDKVKAKFSSQPDIYNRFLDIMKEFKTQLIDTPGVIERVSNLFKGDSVLISGFNTFLPIGYSIECNTIDNRIKVITPSGTTTISDSESFHLKHPTDPKETGDGGPLEINHAINYVHKIKNCFTDRPEIYKEFLEILQNYQKGGKPIHKVYEQVKILLNGSTELLDEFKQFLPEPKLRKKRHGNTTLTIAKRSKHYHTKEEIETSDVRSGRRMDYAWPNFSTEEADFFDKVKSFVDNQLTYGEFLKVLDLFNSHRMDQSTLISRVEGFIGSNQDLMEIFKTLIGYDETNKQEIKPSLDTSDCGPTYRYTPKRLQNNKCSGRDALCWDVLNDTFVSHPTWANEIRTSVACKKNQYEEALDRVEEERYDYDLNIEANLNTVALLEPIAKKISQMTVDEKTNFKLSPDFASTSKTVFLRTLKKIYGSNKGSEMINLLNTNPSQSIPVVLKRLKQKDAEWKRAQREWNKIWREVESKNYWKSLDHQGVLFKLSDRKTLTTQSFVIQAELDEQFQFGFQDKAIFKDVSRLVYFFLESQPIYTREDCLSMRRFMNTIIPAMFDVNDVEPSLMTVDDIGLEEVDDDEFDDKSSVQSLDSVLSNQQNKRRALEIQGKRTSRRNRFERVGLLKNVLMRNTSRIQSSSSEGEDADDEEEQDQVRSEVSSEDQEQRRTHQEETEEEKEEEEEEDDDNEAIEEEKESSMEPDNERMYHFMANDGLYCFFRLYQALYDRLHKMKKLDEEFEKDQRKSKQACKEALDLGITPRRFKTLKMDTKKGYYNVLLALIDKLLEGEVDQQTFEESVRYIFGSDAYVLFTIDKLVLLLVRHIHIIITDAHSQRLFEIFKTEHRAEQMDQGDSLSYKTKVIGILDPVDNVYHITFKRKSRILNVQLLDGNKHLRKSLLTDKDYNEYVAKYINWTEETEGIDQSRLTTTFLKKNLKYDSRKTKNICTGLQYKICRDTYHMLYINGSEDVYTRRHIDNSMDFSDMNNRWKQWLDTRFNENHDPVHTEEQAKSLYQ